MRSLGIWTQEESLQLKAHNLLDNISLIYLSLVLLVEIHPIIYENPYGMLSHLQVPKVKDRLLEKKNHAH